MKSTIFPQSRCFEKPGIWPKSPNVREDIGLFLGHTVLCTLLYLPLSNKMLQIPYDVNQNVCNKILKLLASSQVEQYHLVSTERSDGWRYVDKTASCLEKGGWGQVLLFYCFTVFSKCTSFWHWCWLCQNKFRQLCWELVFNCQSCRQLDSAGQADDSFKILKKLQLHNLDQTSITGLVWQNSVKQGKERLRDFLRGCVIYTQVVAQRTW